MKNNFRKFALRLILLSAILVIISTALILLLPADIITPVLPFMILYFFLITIIVHYFLTKAIGYSSRKFVSYFMLTTFLKLFIYIITIFTYVYFNRSDLLPFIISFFVLYIFYTVFEVVNITHKTVQ